MGNVKVSAVAAPSGACNDFEVTIYLVRQLRKFVCANLLTGKLNGLEAGISFHREKNALQMATAAAEATYFKAQKNLVLIPSVETQSAFSNAEQNLQELGTRSAAPSTGADVINGGSLLETMRIEFKF